MAVEQRAPRTALRCRDGLQRTGEELLHPRIVMGHGERLVREHLGQHGDRERSVERLHPVAHGGQRPVFEGDQIVVHLGRHLRRPLSGELHEMVRAHRHAHAAAA
ncbi:hypothetical protein CTI14_41935, partial [Methylobacterium radiotolerans]